MAVQPPASVDLSKYIETRYFGERPHIRGRRIPVATVAYNAQTNGWSIAGTAENFGLNEAEVLAALLYYQEHQMRIDAQEAEEIRLGEAMRRQHGGS